jgi:hypothetical protein
VSDRVNPAMKAVKPPPTRATIDRVLTEPELHELSSRHDTVLSPGERCDLEVRVN